jgi:two-component system response regulator YesN
MNTEAVAKELAIIHEYFSSNRYKWMQSNEMLILLLTLLNAELIEISGDRIHLERFAEFQQACLSDRSYEMVQSLICKAMEEIRQLRNWGTHRIILKALELIHQSYMEKSLSLQEVAMCVGISPNYFSKCFREEVGISFSLYIARLRMNKAIELLNDPLFKVYEVAHASGFSDYAHFAKVFKKNFEFSPTEYRVNVGII